MNEKFNNFENMENKFSDRVYFVSSPYDSSVVVAMDISIEGNNIRWFDTVKERLMTIKNVIQDESGKFVFNRADNEGGGVYEIGPMTLDIYNSNIKQKLLSPKEFSSEEELFAAFEETRKNAW